MIRPRFIGRAAFAAAAALVATSLALSAQAPTQPRNYDQHRQMAAASPFKDVPWQFVGPSNVSGRVTDVDVAIRPGRTRAIYVATASGGGVVRNMVTAPNGDIWLACSGVNKIGRVRIRETS